MELMQHLELNSVSTMTNGSLSSTVKDLHHDLVVQCRDGDQKAQFQLYKLYYKAMYNTSLRIVNDSMEAEDIMQEAFLSAFEKIHTFSGKVTFGAWLKRIVINRSLDALNKKKMITEDIDDHYKLVDDSPDPGNGEDLSLQVEEVREAISRLPHGYRVILSLYLLEGYDHEEIGEIMNISSSTSRSQFSRARMKLVQLLKEEKQEF